MLTNHKLIPALLAATFSILLSLNISAYADGHGQKLDKIGVQLYSLRTETEKDLETVLNKISGMGYQQVELHTLYNMKAAELKLLLDKYHLSAPSTHRGYQQIKEDLMGTVSDARILGLDYVIIPWMDTKQYKLKENWLAFSEDLNRIGKILKAHNVQLAYHNHDFEFKALADGSIPYDILLENTDPELVALQLDLYWIVKAGKDPIAYIEKNSGRIISVHVKDMDKDGKMTEVGSGEIDFANIFKVGKQHGLKYFIVEHDHPENPFSSVEKSVNYLKQLEF